jgi:hypothetical protein
MKSLVIIPCGKSKIWDKDLKAQDVAARFVYTSSYFKVNKEYAEKNGSEWLILSAKYGLIPPDFIISDNYDISFNNPSSNPISIERVQDQARNYPSFDFVTALGGKTYTDIVSKVFTEIGLPVLTPSKGLPLGISMRKVKNAIIDNTPFTPQIEE